jgi:alkylation response protein AidB-like acyl-CoA dehydrogenase
MGIGGNFAPETGGVALGLARRGLAEITSSAATRTRGGKGASLAERGAFLLELGRRRMQHEAAFALAEAQLAAAWDVAQTIGYLPDDQQAQLRALASYCVESSADVLRSLWPFLGASELKTERALQRCLRDLTAMTQHYHVSNLNYEVFAQTLLSVA